MPSETTLRALVPALHRVGVVVHPRRDPAELLAVVGEWAQGLGVQVLGLSTEADLLPPEMERGSEPWMGERAELVIAIGGDGTILRALKLASPHRRPVLGVNLGRLAFLAEVDADELPEALHAIARDEGRVEAREALSLVPEGSAADLGPRVAYNDVAVTRIPGQGPAALGVEVGGEAFARFTADALVVSTPTGSTAYSFSAGGPILSPRVPGLLVTPVAPHSAFDRAMILHPDEGLRVTALERSAPLLVEADGRAVGELAPGGSLRIALSADPALVVRMRTTSFYQRVRAKLGIADSVEVALRGDGPGA
jgi:NAD+ kinase